MTADSSEARPMGSLQPAAVLLGVHWTRMPDGTLKEGYRGTSRDSVNVIYR